MCGIFACLFCDGGDLPPQVKVDIHTKLKRRGPDVINELTIPVHLPTLRLNLIGSLLQMRGDPIPQPHPVSVTTPSHTTTTNYLLWNGNVFGGGIKVPPSGNDTVILAQELAAREESLSGVLTTLSSVHGPWALVYWQESTRSLWFGRDVFGRRSLLWHTPCREGEPFILCSVGHYAEREMPLGYWEEVPANGVYQLKCHGPDMESSELVCYPWVQGDETFQSGSTIHEEMAGLKTLFKTRVTINHCLQVPFPKLNKLTPNSPSPRLTQKSASFVGPDTATKHTKSKEKMDCQNTSSHSCPQTKESSTWSEDEAKSKAAAERPSLSPLSSAAERPSLSPLSLAAERPSLSPLSSSLPSVTAYPLSPAQWSVLSQQFLEVLQEAVHTRVMNAPRVPSHKSYDISPSVASDSLKSRSLDSCEVISECTTCLPSDASVTDCEVTPCVSQGGTCGWFVSSTSEASHSKDCAQSNLSLNTEEPRNELRVPSKQELAVGREGGVEVGGACVSVLYSGGVDSTVLAALADRCLGVEEPIDLINVAFEQKSLPPEKRYDVPDRVSALESLKELNPKRQWNLVLVNVMLEEVNELRSSRVSHMIYPLCTVLDDSIGCALWFAARGEGLLHRDQRPPIRYQSQARTLFIGIGADEQLAGYSRHRTKFNSGGWGGLNSELEMDIKRLAKRNLGRDDRCVADHQREGQFPFLDEGVVTFLQSLPVHHKADLTLPRGQGEKRLLREVAHLLGCHGASQLPKRAIQFGSRMAKMAGTSSNREQGSAVTERLLPGHKK